ncbi:hypothetical protein LDENG_00230130, partial [Lucifuga dentata]
MKLVQSGRLPPAAAETAACCSPDVRLFVGEPWPFPATSHPGDTTLWAVCNLKAITWAEMSTRPCPPSSTGRYKAEARIQCCPDQKKFTRVCCMSSMKPLGGERTFSLCHSVE